MTATLDTTPLEHKRFCLSLTFLEPTVLETEESGLGVAMDLTSIGEKVAGFCEKAGEEEKMKGNPKLFLQMVAEASITINFFIVIAWLR